MTIQSVRVCVCVDHFEERRCTMEWAKMLIFRCWMNKIECVWICVFECVSVLCMCKSVCCACIIFICILIFFFSFIRLLCIRMPYMKKTKTLKRTLLFFLLVFFFSLRLFVSNVLLLCALLLATAAQSCWVSARCMYVCVDALVYLWITNNNMAYSALYLCRAYSLDTHSTHTNTHTWLLSRYIV